jgi:NADP-dependent 3-hydroxy acid dehydrogenase YdfG
MWLMDQTLTDVPRLRRPAVVNAAQYWLAPEQFARHCGQLGDRFLVPMPATGPWLCLTDPEDIKRVFAKVDEVFGGVDILVNNAALPADGIMEMEDAEWRYAVEANLVGQLACAREAAARMIEAGRGHIVFIGSMSAEVREKGSSVYVAAKAGIEGFAAALRKELNEKGIKVSLIEPGSVSSDMASPSAERQREMIRDELMLRAEDIAVCVHFILTQPARTDVIVMQVRPHRQEI